MTFLFPKIKSALKGTRFESVDAVRAKATELMNKLSEDDLASNSGRFAWSGVGIGEESTLRATTFLLCNFLNKICSNISPVILYPHHVHGNMKNQRDRNVLTAEVTRCLTATTENTTVYLDRHQQ